MDNYGPSTIAPNATTTAMMLLTAATTLMPSPPQAVSGDMVVAASTAVVAAPALFVVFYLMLINFLGSFIQGVTTFGDAIVIQILWHALASATGGEWLHQSPLGGEDVQAMAVLQYSRTCVLNPLVAKLAYSAGARFVPRKLIVASIVPQLLATIFGEHLLVIVPHDVLKFYFGVVCITFAVVFTAVKIYRYWVVEHRNAVVEMEPPSLPETGSAGLALDGISVNQEDKEGSDSVPTTPAASPTTAAANRSLDSHPALLFKTQVAFVITSAVAGITGALTGVGGPPFMITILLLDLPPAFVRLLFPLATLPSLYVRYGLAIHDGLITWDMIPYHVASVAAGVVGVLCGNKIGKCVGPKTFNVVVFVLLLLASMMMLVDIPLLSVTMLVAGVGVMAWVWVTERRDEREEREAIEQLEAEEKAAGADGRWRPAVTAVMSAEALPRLYDEVGDTEILPRS